MRSTFTPICSGSVQPATSYGRSGDAAWPTALHRIRLFLEQRLGVGAERLRHQDEIGAGGIHRVGDPKRLERALDLDRAVEQQLAELVGGVRIELIRAGR